MKSKIVSFQIVQGYDGHSYRVESDLHVRTGSTSGYRPDVIALCEDGTLWIIGLSAFHKGETSWTLMNKDSTPHASLTSGDENA